MRKFLLPALVIAGLSASAVASADGVTLPQPPRLTLTDGVTLPQPPRLHDGVTLPQPPRLHDGVSLPQPPR